MHVFIICYVYIPVPKRHLDVPAIKAPRLLIPLARSLARAAPPHPTTNKS